MNARDNSDPARRRVGRRLAFSALLALFMLFGHFSAAASAGTSTTPGKPTAKSPASIITTSKPTFKWSRAARAGRYEVRVYRGPTLLLRETGISQRSWKCSKALPRTASLTWKVRAGNSRGIGAWSKSLKFTVAGTAKAITAFSFAASGGTGVIDETAHTIALTVPFGTDVTALVATFTTTGAAVAAGNTPQVSGVTANDFSSPVTYVVAAADHTTLGYTVTVTVAASATKAITAFGFAAPGATGVIDETARTIALAVPFGTDVTALVATFTTTGAAVAAGNTPQVSGVTANDFSSPVTYVVSAADRTTLGYTVTVTVAARPPAIGDLYQGGMVGYIFESWDHGYVVGETHGLIVATADQSAGMQWCSHGNEGTDLPTSTGIGHGLANTLMIIASETAPANSYAAGIARSYSGGGYQDWYLPSYQELYEICINTYQIAGYAYHAEYWSSSQYSRYRAWIMDLDFTHMPNYSEQKNLGWCPVRAVRTF